MVLFTGKGGVGKTTAAAATAVRLADRGVRTLLLSADAAHSVGDVLGVTVGERPTAVAPHLSAVHLDTQRRFEAAWSGVQRYLLELAARAGVDAVTAAEVTVLPGVEEVLALLAVREFADSGAYDALVVDCGPTAETLRLLALPDALGWYLRTVLPAQRRAVRGLRPLAAVLGRPEAVPPEGLFDAVVTLHAQLAAVRDLLDRAGTVRLVLTPEAMVLAETRRTYTALALYGYRVDGVVVNRVLAPAGPAETTAGDPGPAQPAADPWRAAWVEAQARHLAETAESFAGLPLYRASYGPAEPVGTDALRVVAAELYGTDRADVAGEPAADPDRDPLDPGPEPDLLTVVPDGTGYALHLALPLAVRGEVHAARTGDDLVVTVGSHRRVLALPSVLRRCVVARGRLEPADAAGPARLVLPFTPDPDRWPAGVPLPGAEPSGDTP